jgi:hypothetical protein
MHLPTRYGKEEKNEPYISVESGATKSLLTMI